MNGQRQWLAGGTDSALSAACRTWNLPLNLFSRLLLAHSLPVALVSMALGLTLLALTRMTTLLQEVTDVEIRSLKLESDVHHATWLVDIALGHAYSACQTGSETEQLHGDIAQAANVLRAKLDAIGDIGSKLHIMANRWLALAAKVERNIDCSVLGTELFRSERDRLDDELTALWSQRLSELHTGVAHKDAEARGIGKTALHMGGAIAASACMLAMLLARTLAKTLSQPLARLALTARRIGAGDFSPSIEVHGPSEVVTLAAEFRRMGERLAQLEQLKQGFLASVSHELRTPLSKLREAISLLKDGVVGPLTPDQKRVLSIAATACEREIRMVSTLLDLSRLRAGSPIRPRTGRIIDDVIRRAVAEEQAELSDRDVPVDIDLEGPAPVSHVDAVLVERSIANLVRNALAVSQNGQRVLVRRDLTLDDRTGQRLIRITVADQGPGVPEDIRDTVFNAFVTSVVPRSPKALGIGLGLALAREVALVHGGDLILDTSAQKGATFHLLLPLVPEARAPVVSLQPKQLGIFSSSDKDAHLT